jgi:hypothetical protein
MFHFMLQRTNVKRVMRFFKHLFLVPNNDANLRDMLLKKIIIIARSHFDHRSYLFETDSQRCCRTDAAAISQYCSGG